MSEIEADFALNEMFFSKTDFKGHIQSGNKVFLRVSEFEEIEILHRPHNIIRHNDMPRTVFKLFWSYLQAGRPIAAYVKNKSKSSRYYWVFAMAFPMDDGYLSVRLKPSSPFFGPCQEIYRALLDFESNNSNLDEGLQLLKALLEKRGFSSYEEFMNQALLAELKSRDQILAKQEHGNDSAEKSLRIEDLLEASGHCTGAARTAFTVADILSERFRNKTSSADIEKICRQVQMVTTNLTIAASKLGEAGKTLSVVSQNLARLTGDIAESSQDFDRIFASFSKAATGMNIAMATSRFQIEMMNHLIEETELTDDEGTLLKNCGLLKKLIASNFESVEEIAKVLIKENKSLNRSITMLGKVTAGMDVICVVGKIEMARINDLSSSLTALLADMEKLTEDFKGALRLIDDDSKWGLIRSSELRNHLSSITHNLRKIENVILG